MMIMTFTRKAAECCRLRGDYTQWFFPLKTEMNRARKFGVEYVDKSSTIRTINVIVLCNLTVI